MTIWTWRIKSKWHNFIAVMGGLAVSLVIIGTVTFSIDTVINTNEISAAQYSEVERWATEFPEIKKKVIAPRLEDKKLNQREFREIKQAVEVKKRESFLNLFGN